MYTKISLSFILLVKRVLAVSVTNMQAQVTTRKARVTSEPEQMYSELAAGTIQKNPYSNNVEEGTNKPTKCFKQVLELIKDSGPSDDPAYLCIWVFNYDLELESNSGDSCLGNLKNGLCVYFCVSKSLRNHLISETDPTKTIFNVFRSGVRIFKEEEIQKACLESSYCDTSTYRFSLIPNNNNLLIHEKIGITLNLPTMTLNEFCSVSLDVKCDTLREKIIERKEYLWYESGPKLNYSGSNRNFKNSRIESDTTSDSNLIFIICFVILIAPSLLASLYYSFNQL